LEVFDELAERGVELRILHARLPSQAFRDELDRHPRLIQGGLQLRMCPRVHLKTLIIDGERMYLGSANWTGAGLGAKGEHRRNFELGVITDDELWLDEVQALYEEIWRGRPCRECRLRDECEAPLGPVS
jgi:phosphatidylserine/phosphatidylglycerophosphate/cardiolipin synthase-like enzyme